MTKKMNDVQRFLILLSCIIGCLMLAGCGQKGPLYLPQGTASASSFSISILN